MGIEEKGGKEHSLKWVEDHEAYKNKLKFPLKVKWNWLSPYEMKKASTLDRAWFYWKGLLANEQLRGVSMKCHARLHLVNQQLRLLTEGMIIDTYKAAEEGVEQREQEQTWEIE